MAEYKYWIECSDKIADLCESFGGTLMPIDEIHELFGPEVTILPAEELNDGFHYTRGMPDPEDPIEKCVYMFKTKEAYYKIIKELDKIYNWCISSIKQANEYTLGSGVKRPIKICQAHTVLDIFYDLHYTVGYNEVSSKLLDLFRWAIYVIQAKSGEYKTPFDNDLYSIFLETTILELHEF